MLEIFLPENLAILQTDGKYIAQLIRGDGKTSGKTVISYNFCSRV